MRCMRKIERAGINIKCQNELGGGVKYKVSLKANQDEKKPWKKQCHGWE